MNRPALRSVRLPRLPGILALILMLAGCGGGGGGSTQSVPPPGVTINPPGNVTATGSDRSVSVAWSNEAGAVAYNLYWSYSPGVTKANGQRVANASNPYVHGGLPIDELYYYVVCSIHASGTESAESAVVSAWSAAIHASGSDVGQYFDRGIQAGGAQNYDDRSSHPLRGLTTGDNSLRFGGSGSPNCLGCHYASGPARTGDECLMCHYENNGASAALGPQHADGILQLASLPAGDGFGTAAYPISSIQEYDDWCLQCHSATTYSLGNVFPTASRRTLIDPAAFANGLHRANAVGCIHCHQPHGRGNARIVRENPYNRSTAGGVPRKFGVFPADNLGGGSYGAAQNKPYRARVDNNAATGNVFADADDDVSFCNTACHQARTNFRYSKDKRIKRDAATGNYLPAGSGMASKKVYLIQGANASPTEYTNDNIVLGYPADKHGHPNGEIITTSDMVDWWGALINLSGPSFYKYPGTGNADPDAYGSAQNFAAAQAGNLWLFPDAPDGARDFPNGYAGFGRIRYRYTCSTCHDPHGTTGANSPGTDPYYPDLRLPKTGPGKLCDRCHY